MKLFIFITLFFSQILFANNLNTNELHYKNFEIKYYEDISQKLNFENIKKVKFLNKSKSNFNLGYKKGNIWLKIEFLNNSEYKNFILTLNETFYETANLYYENNKKNIIQKNGLIFPIEKRSVKSNYLAFNIEVNQNEKQTLYLLLKGKYAYFGDIEIFESSYFNYENFYKIGNFYIFLLGIMFIILMFSTFLYVKIKERIYLYYSSYIFFNIIYLINMSGLLVYFNIQSFIYKIHFSSALMLCFLILFSLEYLNIKRIFTKIYKVLLSISIFFILLAILILFEYEPWNKVINNLAGAICLSLILLSLFMYLKGYTKTKYYSLGLLIYFFSVLLFTFMVNGTFEYNNLTRYGFLFGIFVEIIIFSFLLANRYHEINEDNKIRLEELVNDRTKDILKLADEKELLLKEIHHRVKNNFHTINGILYFESLKNNENSHTFLDIANRIKSMSMIHEYIYKSDNFKRINSKEYLENIIKSVQLSNHRKQTNISMNIEDILLNFEDALNIGVILNEVLTNSIKHNDIFNLLCHVNFYKRKNLITLEIKDNGKGFNLNNSTKSLGLNIIEDFSNKLKCSKHSFENSKGLTYTLVFQM